KSAQSENSSMLQADTSVTQNEPEEEDTEVNEYNRPIVANALGIDENARSLRFLLSALDTLKAGKIQKAEATEDKGSRALDIVAEDGTNYRILLTGSGSPDGAINLDTGEWVIKSAR
ncbi:MAG: hypothetical protein J6Z22_07355, partial [Lachnospiraceae bacterium]|nr:hypothetical protein [Lachnospiraceae bacterium]